jgi:hypothetical protein
MEIGRDAGFAFMLLQSKRALQECPIVSEDVAFTDRHAQLAALVG